MAAARDRHQSDSPLRDIIARASLLKGSGLADLWPNFLGLFVITLVLFSLSVWRSETA